MIHVKLFCYLVFLEALLNVIFYDFRSEMDIYISKWTFVQLQKFRDELKNRSRVLRKLGHIDADGVVLLKGRAASLIDTGDELLVTELMFNGKIFDIFLVLVMYLLRTLRICGVLASPHLANLA